MTEEPSENELDDQAGESSANMHANEHENVGAPKESE
jgi:hypothetical protein